MIAKGMWIIMQRKKLSYAKLSILTGVSAMYLCEIVNGKKKPSFKILKKICDALGLDYESVSLDLFNEKLFSYSNRIESERLEYTDKKGE